MRVLLHDDTPAYLCHGGKQVLATSLHQALADLGVDVQYTRWWDDGQKCDVIHSLGCSTAFVRMAHEAGIKVVLTHIVDEMTSSARSRQLWHQARNAAIRSFAPDSLARLFSWHALPEIDELVYITRGEAEIAIATYAVARARTHVIGHGCDSLILARCAGAGRMRGSYLVSVGSIVPRKNSVVLARAARRARVPLVFLGGPFTECDPYFAEFRSLVDDKWVVYPGYASESAKIDYLLGASGFVLASLAESGCLAAHEAAAAGLPMLLSDKAWARSYGSNPNITLAEPTEEALASALIRFFDASERLEHPTFPVMSWPEVAGRYLKVYEAALAR